jgi:putative transcriptional regulator
MALKSINFTGHLLIAMPSMCDPYFAKTVTFICTHNADGAMGIIINQPTNVKLDELYENIKVTLDNDIIKDQPVLFGGPVQPERGFVLHLASKHDDSWNSCVNIREQIALTSSKDILEAIAIGKGPEKFHLSLGYAGWTPGQLEQEILENAWLSVEIKEFETLHKILYETPYDEMLPASMKLLGIDPAMLSSNAGHA